MAFQQFRLGELSLHNSITPHIPGALGPSHTTFATNPHKSVASSSKAPYGSGDSDDGYTLRFPNLEAFQAWREEEEERNMVEFVKGDTHGSKAVPPRFKDHTKLVCARHSRSGRKKYVKKHPERVRKVPSRKLEGVGCPASISYKTYYDTEEMSQRTPMKLGSQICPSPAKAARRLWRTKRTNNGPKSVAPAPPPTASPSSSSLANAVPPITTVGTATSGPPADTSNQIMTSPPAMQVVIQQQPPQPQQQQQQPPQQQQVQQQHIQQPVQQVLPNTAPMQQQQPFSSSVTMIAPLPAQQAYQAPQTYGYAPQQAYPAQAQDRWENMATLFSTIRDHARSFEYPVASVAALETVLIRLYLESPMNVGTPSLNLGAVLQHTMQVRQTAQGQTSDGGHPGGTS
ncbi:hypothetical protein NMY22_g11087 [Coprinellus aureogranulatus]|nr:hypothetical protein NMY22_g11087 [Coprinellus aureogranulatus]